MHIEFNPNAKVQSFQLNDTNANTSPGYTNTYSAPLPRLSILFMTLHKSNSLFTPRSSTLRCIKPSLAV